MSRSIIGRTGLAALIGALLAFGGGKEASAEVNININIGPPPIVVAEPPEVVLIPGLMVYFVPRLEFDLFFYKGYWWSPRGSRWYRAKAYNGPWKQVHKRVVPAPVHRVPKGYRKVYEKEQHIPYGQLKKQMKQPGKVKGKELKQDEKQERKAGKKKNQE